MSLREEAKHKHRFEIISSTMPETTINEKWSSLWRRQEFHTAEVPLETLKRVKFGVITNLNAGSVKNSDYNRSIFENMIGHMGLVRESRSIEGLSDVIHEFKENGVNVIIVNGGDGTMGSVASEVFYAYEEDMPAFFPLRGGTLNATAKAIGIPRASAFALLDRLVRLVNSKYGGIQESWLGALRVRDPRMKRDRYGFIFANGIAYDFDRYIYSLGGTQALNAAMGIILLNIHGFFGTPIGKEVWRKTRAEVEIDGEAFPFEEYKIGVVSTVFDLFPLIKPFPPPPHAREGKFSYIVNGMNVRKVFRHPYALLRDKYKGDLHRTGHAQRVKFSKYNGGYMLDGEIYAHNDDIEIEISFGIPIKIWGFETSIGALR